MIDSFKKSIKSVWKAELYLFKLMVRQNGLAGILVICFGLIVRFWWNIAAPFIEKELIDEFVYIYTNNLLTTMVWFFVFALLGGKVFVNFLSSISEIINEYIQNKATLYLDKEVMKRIVNVADSYFDDPQNQDAISAANQSKTVVSESIGWFVSMFVSVVGFIGSAVIFLSLNPFLGIIFLMTYIPGAIIENKNKKEMRSFSINNIPENRKKDYYRSLLTSIDTAKDLRLYNLTKYFKKKYEQLWELIRNKRYSVFKKGALRSFAASLLTSMGTIIIIVYSVSSILHKSMTLGEMSLYISLALSAGGAFSLMLNQIIGHWKYCIPEVNRFLDFLQYDTDTEYGNENTMPIRPTIEFKNVSFRYPSSDVYALQNVSFRIEYGEKIAIIGINGSGKTTIIKLLLRFYKPESGEILLNGTNIWKYSAEVYSRIFGICFQEITRYAITLRENIALSNIEWKEDESKIKKAARASGINRIVSSLTNKYDSDVTRYFNDAGVELSGGQWQKVAISRAFFSNAPVIVLDEPSSALDPEAEDDIFRSFKKLCKYKSGILISHRLSSSILVDRMLLLENGKIIESGTHEELIAKNGRYSELYRIQAKKYKIPRETI